MLTVYFLTKDSMAIETLFFSSTDISLPSMRKMNDMECTFKEMNEGMPKYNSLTLTQWVSVAF